MDPAQQTPPVPEQKPNIDDLIARTRHQEYSFQNSQTNRGLGSWFTDLPRKNKLFLIGGGVGIALIILVVTLMPHNAPKGNLASTLQQSNSSSATTASTANADGSGSSASLADDTNGDGVVDEYDTSDTSSSVGVSWWQRMINTVNSRNTSSGTSDDTDSSSSTSSDSSSSSNAGDSSDTSSAVSPQESTEENQEEQQTSSPPPAASTPTQQTPTTPTTPKTPTTSATITLSGVTNFRDAASSSSGLMKSGVLYRSAKLQNATTSDRAKLASLLKNGVIIDLRTASVRKSQPDKSVSGVTNISYPINSASSADSYVKEFVNNATDRSRFGQAITKIAGTKGSVLVHCTAGKDRTGWTVAMVMYALGANDKQVMDEYLKSKEYGATVDAAWLNAALKEAKAKNGGSIIKYIKSTTSGLGVTDATIQKLKTKFSPK